jgi:acyl-CoA thioester hydrolase
MPLTPPAGFRHHTPIYVRWADMDALGHVNNAKFLTYLEQARINYFNDLKLWDGNLSDLGLIMARIVLDYKLPLVVGDDAHVFTRCSRFGTRSLDTEQLILRVNEDHTEIAAQGTITAVVYDYQKNQSAPIPDGWRERILEYEPGQIAR